MRAWWPWLAMVVLPGGILIASLELLRRRHAREHAADYVTRIAVLKSDTPLALPTVRPLRAVKKVVAPEPKKRRRAPSRNRVSRFEQRLTRKA